MATVDLDGIRKAYDKVKALDGVSLSVRSGEFFTLLGPSGCGKTTLLRTIAGFHRQDQGSIRVADRPIDDVPAYRRDIGMVFQDYAVFPHMTVADNVAFGLKNRRCARAEITQRVGRALELVRLDGHAGRMPHQLSGGQQQRVGLARAMVINPQILLMDEPLSNLDAKLRIELREDIGDLQRSLGITTIYVTHDQEEALVVSDRICVMQHGKVHQVGTPWEVYKRPATLFVATFVGAMSIIERLPDSLLARVERATGRRPLRAGIRPEDVVVGAEPDGEDGAVVIAGRLAKVSFAGREAVCFVETEVAGTLQAVVPRPTAELLASVDSRIDLRLPLERLLLYDAEDRLIADAAT